MTGEPTAILDDESFGMRVHEHGRPTLVLFTSGECLPCHFMAAQLPKLAVDLHYMIDTVVCPAELSPATFARHAVARTPTLRLFVAGRPVASRDGALPLPAVHEWIAAELRGALTPAPAAGNRPPPGMLRSLVARSTIVRACRVASVIAPVLLLVNHAELVLSQPIGWAVLKRLGANFIVPYLVSSYSSARAAVSHRLEHTAPAPPTPP
ncbi:MAG: thioredoxin family protein [Gemmatimonadaceae bacterium]|nr:thioredoxin family protein [Gemmatimonadaceae bacterium]